MKNVYRTMLISTLLFAFFSGNLFAVDEDYFIPYTDNYGYEYDPETGTYIKNESDPMPAPNHPQSASTETTGTTVQQTESQAGADSANITSEDTNPGLLLFVAGAIILLGGLMVFIRR